MTQFGYVGTQPFTGLSLVRKYSLLPCRIPADEGLTLVHTVKTRSRWADVAAGAQDDNIIAYWEAVAAYGKPIICGYHHEPEDDSVKFGTAKQYRAAARHVFALADSVGVPNATRTHIGMAYHYENGSERHWFPGDCVDLVGADGYCWCDCQNNGGVADPSKPTRTLESVFDSTVAFASDWGMPSLLGEFGIAAGLPDQVRADWVTQGVAYLKSVNAYGACYFNSDQRPLGCDFRLGNAVTAYQAATGL